MKFDKYLVCIIDDDRKLEVTREELLDVILDFKNQPMRVIPIDCDDNLIYSYGFLVGEDYSLSFLFNTKDY